MSSRTSPLVLVALCCALTLSACKSSAPAPDTTPAEQPVAQVEEETIEEAPVEPPFCPEGAQEYNRQEYHWCSDAEGRMQGPFIARSAGGDVIVEGRFEDDLMEGEWKGYYPGGGTRWKAPFVDGKEEGVVEGYDEKGTLRHAISYAGGSPSGKAYYYSAEGQKVAELEYEAGQPSGTWLYWHENGQKYHEFQYIKKGKTSIHKHWDESGKKFISPVGQLAKSAILPNLEPLEEAIVSCYTHTRIMDDSNGKLVAQIHIGYGGEVSQSELFTEDFKHPFMEACTRREIEALSFPDNPYGPQMLIRTWHLSVE